ncbi:VTT domain-containing protein [Chryseobacterium sp. D764]|jgi:membrane-associated protein|uniref:DedA family protein n=1 Tax=unclassified Chryseobacterium TaxID=2593645 RepID=UPI0009844098|nr:MULTISPECIES: VTT domain-containing protein [unclassified Chryseobacterium]QXU49283.1 VTT domain-containing protein [Chryseobacterium sp. D764]CAD0224798.1 Alkaline phosphatase [Chryseobacterium sp. JV274]
MEDFNSWKDLLNPEFYIKMGGFWLILFIVFAETGLFVGFFLPGDSLLFVSGIYAVEIIKETFGSTGSDFLDTTLLASGVALAAIIGNEVGYYFGRKAGPALYKRPDSMLFKKKYLYQAHDFFEKHGALAIIMARFLPVVRTFTPIVAGIVKMDKKEFLRDNVIGAVLWSFILIFAGHYLDKLFMEQFGINLKEKLEYIIIVIVLVTTLPVIFKFVFGKKEDLSKKYEDQDFK